LHFAEDDHVNKTFSVALRNPLERRVGFGVTFLDKSGGMLQTPKSHTLEPRIVLRSDMQGHRVIKVSAPKVDFTAKKLKELDVALRYVDSDAALQFAGQVTLKSNTDRGTFEFNYVDSAKARYEYRLSATFLNQMTQPFDAQTSDADDLNVTL